MPKKTDIFQLEMQVKEELRDIKWEDLQQQSEQQNAAGSLFGIKAGTIAVGLIAIAVGLGVGTFWPLVVAGIVVTGIGIRTAIGIPNVEKIKLSGIAFMILSPAVIWYGASQVSTSPQTAGFMVTIAGALIYLGNKIRSDSEKTIADFNASPNEKQALLQQIDQVIAERGGGVILFLDPGGSNDRALERARAWLLDNRVIVNRNLDKKYFLKRDQFQVTEKNNARFSKKIKVEFYIDNVGWIEALMQPEDLEFYKHWKEA